MSDQATSVLQRFNLDPKTEAAAAQERHKRALAALDVLDEEIASIRVQRDREIQEKEKERALVQQQVNASLALYGITVTPPKRKPRVNRPALADASAVIADEANMSLAAGD